MAAALADRFLTPRIAVTTARFYAGRALSRSRWFGADMRVSGTTKAGLRVTLRRPRPSDAAAWRAIRLRDRKRIEPYWQSSELDWPSRHTEKVWVRHCLHARALARAGQALLSVVEVDGRFAGECNLEWIDHNNAAAECGMWIDSAAGAGVASTALALMVDYAFDELAIFRVSAPISVENAPAAGLAKHIGFVKEGTMRTYLDVGGRRVDHDLWALTRDSRRRVSRDKSQPH